MRKADPHNFGRVVSKTTEGGVSYFEKPRPIFWEWLFFGNDSPLRDVFSHTLFEDAIFGLDFVFDPVTGKGRSREVLRTTDSFPGPFWKSQQKYGLLMAYGYVLGILDLHEGNLIPTDGRIQVIDAEIALARLRIPDETLLLPFKEVSFRDCGLRLLFNSQDEISSEYARVLISAFVEGLIQLESSGPKISTVLERELTSYPGFPVRVILRNTPKYYELDRTTFENPLMPEELVQLERGDIPYFFKLYGRNELYYFVSPEGDRQAVNVPEAFREAVDRIACSPSELLSSERLRQQLFPAGLLLLARKLLPDTFSGHLDVGHSQLQLTATEIQVSGPWGSFKTNRVRAVT